MPNITASAVVNTGAVFTVTLTRSTKTFECPADKFVLDAAFAAGLKLPSACRQGVCGTCKSKLQSGRVDMRDDGGIRPRDIENGFFLPCCSYPLTDLVIEK